MSCVSTCKCCHVSVVRLPVGEQAISGLSLVMKLSNAQVPVSVAMPLPFRRFGSRVQGVQGAVRSSSFVCCGGNAKGTDLDLQEKCSPETRVRGKLAHKVFS